MVSPKGCCVLLSLFPVRMPNVDEQESLSDHAPYRYLYMHGLVLRHFEFLTRATHWQSIKVIYYCTIFFENHVQTAFSSEHGTSAFIYTGTHKTSGPSIRSYRNNEAPFSSTHSLYNLDIISVWCTRIAFTKLGSYIRSNKLSAKLSVQPKPFQQPSDKFWTQHDETIFSTIHCSSFQCTITRHWLLLYQHTWLVFRVLGLYPGKLFQQLGIHRSETQLRRWTCGLFEPWGSGLCPTELL